MSTVATKERPILMSTPMVRAILDGRKSQTRREVLPSNSTVLGYPAKSYWDNLHFDHAEKRTTTLMGALAGEASDVNLAVPFRHPDDRHIPIGDCGKYAVRPKWEVGDRLWVRESFRVHCGEDARIEYCAGGVFEPQDEETTVKVMLESKISRRESEAAMDGKDIRPQKRPSIFMPRWACRIELEVTAVRVERVQDISEADAQAEGVERPILSATEIAGQPVHPMTGHYRDGYAALWNSINGKGSWESSPWVWAVSFKRIEVSK